MTVIGVGGDGYPVGGACRDGSAEPREGWLGRFEAAVGVAVAGGGVLGVESAGDWCQPVAAGSALSFWNAAMSSVAQGQSCCSRSRPRRPWNASRPATCSSR